MGELKRSALKLAWLWVIEYVARLQQLDPSYLHALIDEAPELIDDLGDEVRERVALRCLEHLFGSRNESETNDPSSTIDFSRSCDDVLLSILKETSILDLRTGNDLLKWDMQPFIKHKRTTLPKCSLERMKDEFLEGVHPCTAFLIKHSGLMHKDDDDDDDDDDNDRVSTDCFQQNVSGRDGSIGTRNSPIIAETGDSHHQNLLPLKRNGDAVDNDNQADHQNDQGDGDLHLNAKRLKCNVSSANEGAAEHALSPQFDDNEFVEEEPFERMTKTREKESLHAESEPRVKGLDECVSIENGHEKFVAGDGIHRSANPDAMCDNGTKMPRHTFEIRNGTSSGRIQQKVSVVDKQKSPIDVSSSGSPIEFVVVNCEDSAEHLFEEEDTSSDGDEFHRDKFDAALKRSLFLSSQCTQSNDGKSSKDGRFFVCSAVGCGAVVPKDRLGCSPRFDDSGNFYCQFCAYSYAISKYREDKAKVASAKKELAPFLHKYHGRLLGKKHHTVKRILRVEESNETNERHDSEKLEKRKAENKFEEPIISCADEKLMQREEELDVTHGTSLVSPAEKESEGMAQEHMPASGLHREDCVSLDPKLNIANGHEEILVNEKEGEGEIQKEVGQQSNILLEKPVSAVNIVEGKTMDENTKEDTKKQDVLPESSQLVKPNRVPWTAEEEKMLKEGVEKFLDPSKRMPWTKILEYGRSVFWSGRTAMQLKDKWRNIENKSSPKLK